MKNLESPWIIIPLILLVAIGVFVKAAFFGPEEKSEEKKEVTKEKTEEVASFDGESIYKNTCIGCHGDQYQGVVGPTLKGLNKKYDEADIEDILKNGKNGKMPAGLVAGKEKDMAKWLLALK